MIINIITYKDQDIEISVEKNAIMWKATIGGKEYGNAVILKSKKTNDLVSTVAAIVSNAILTYEELKAPKVEVKQTESNEN